MALLKVNVAWNCATEQAKAWLIRVTLDVLNNLRAETPDESGLREAVDSLETEAVDKIFGDAMKRLLE